MAAALATVVLIINLNKTPESEPHPDIDSLPVFEFNLPDGTRRKARLLTIGPREGGGFEVRYWHNGRVRRMTLEPGLELELQPAQPTTP